MRDDGELRTDGESFDRIAEDLQGLRMDAGGVSYAEIVRRIGKLRERNGVPPAVSRPGRTTVYDAFRRGRSRINARLVGEITLALGATDEEAAHWEKRCLRARHANELSRTTVSRPSASPPETTPSTTPVDHLTTSGRIPGTVGLLLACLAVNYFGHGAVERLGLPLYLDMVGTAVAAIALGPWYGALVGVLTNILGMSVDGTVALPFALVNVAGALVWGFGAKSATFNRSIARFFSLNLVVAIACSAVAVPILLTMFGGVTGHGGDAITNSLAASGHPLPLAVVFANLFTSISDKLVAGFTALAVLGLLRKGDPFIGAWQNHPMFRNVKGEAIRRSVRPAM